VTRPPPFRAEPLTALLKRVGPSLSTELVEQLVDTGISADAARQRIARGARDFDVVKLAGIRFQHNARFIYLGDQFGDIAFWRAVERAFERGGASYWAAVSGMKARGGRVRLVDFPIVCGAPASRKGQYSPEHLLDRLKAIQLLEIEEVGEDVFVKFRPLAYRCDPPEVVRARLLAESVALEGVRNWMRKLGFTSYEQTRIRGQDPAPEVSSIAWDLSGPSYIRPMARPAGGKLRPGFVVADIILRLQVDAQTVAAVVRKHDMASALPSIPPIMPFLIADSFTPEGHRLAKQKGLIPTTTAQLLGDIVARALRELVEMLTNLGATAAVNPDHLEKVLRELTRIEGAADNLRGALFELAVAYLVKEVEGGFVKAGVQVTDPWTRRSADIDVLLDRPDGKSVLVIECKAKVPGNAVSLEQARKWREDRVPLIYSALEGDSRYAGRTFTFELWSNGGFRPEAEAWLTAQGADPRFETAWRNGDAVRAYTAQAKSAAITKIMNEHYFRHPLVRLTSASATGRVEDSAGQAVGFAPEPTPGADLSG
jgi:hypothetical protein